MITPQVLLENAKKYSAEPIYRLGAEVTGLDASLKNINVAKLHAKKNNLKIRYLNSSPEKKKIEWKIWCNIMFGNSRTHSKFGYISKSLKWIVEKKWYNFYSHN